jgi:hypothetical protein
LIDQDNVVYLGGIKPKGNRASSIIIILFLPWQTHLFYVPYFGTGCRIQQTLKVNDRWALQNIDNWSQLIIKHTEDTIEYVSEAPNSGIGKMFDNGHIQFDRLDTHEER